MIIIKKLENIEQLKASNVISISTTVNSTVINLNINLRLLKARSNFLEYLIQKH